MAGTPWEVGERFRFHPDRAKLETPVKTVCLINMYLRVFCLCLIFAAWLSSPAMAEDTVYTWVDGDGVTHFSDAPPGKAGSIPGDVETMAMPEGFPDTADAGEDHYYSIANQWQRMQEERSEREERALERERLRIEKARTKQAEAVAAASSTRNESPTIVYGGGVHHSRLPAFAHGRQFFFGKHGKKPGFGRKGHHHKAAHRPTPRGGHRQQNHVGKHGAVNEPRAVASPAVTHKLGSSTGK